MPKISASILSADFSILKDEIMKLEEAGADYITVDVMDCMFRTHNITLGPKSDHRALPNSFRCASHYRKAGTLHKRVHNS